MCEHMSSSAPVTLLRLTLCLPHEEKWSVRERVRPPFIANAKQTVPTFFLSLSAGPATPVMENAQSEPVRAMTPSAIALAHSWLTAPCVEMIPGSTPRTDSFTPLE